MLNRLVLFFSLFVFFASQSPVHAGTGTLRVYTGKLNINTASAADLTRLPGVGEVISYRIVKEREKKGVFRDTKELLRIKGVSERVFTGFKAYVDTKGDNSLKSYLNLNTVTQSLLQSLPGGTAGEARSILNYRKSRGKFIRVEELKSVAGIDDKRYGELAELLAVARQ
jgi:competence protein ComEA